MDTESSFDVYTINRIFSFFQEVIKVLIMQGKKQLEELEKTIKIAKS